MTLTSKRAEYLAVAALFISAIFAVISWLLGRWSGFFAVSSASWFILSACLIWLVLVIQFHQHSLAEQEKLDISQIAQSDRSSTIFQANQQPEFFAVAENRLRVLEKWFIPLFSILIAVYQLGIGFYLLKVKLTPPLVEVEPAQALVCAIAMTAVAFVSFLFSRYATGMSAQAKWRPLRAGGSALAGTAVLCFALAISLAFAHFNIHVFLKILNWVIPVVLALLGLETALNIVMDIYRPRVKEQYTRAAFDSRLLGIINQPGGIFRSVASAIDYQFGFKVSQTWFYKLLERAVLPLFLFGLITFYLMSCFVVLNPNEQAIIEHFGQAMDSAGNKRIVGPGLTFKWPWPIDIAYKYPIEKVKEIGIGYIPKIDPKTNKPVTPREFLWGKQHYEKEYELLVASRQSSKSQIAGAVPVSLVNANVPVHYRVKDLYAFLYNHSDTEGLLEAICYEELTRYAASASIEVDNEAELEHSLLGAGRAEAKLKLTQAIQKAADNEALGVEIVFVGLQGIHPPIDVAQDYQNVVGAVQQKQAKILQAQADRNSILSLLAGSVSEAEKLYELVVMYQNSKSGKTGSENNQLADKLDDAFAQAEGDIFKTLRSAKSYAFEKSTIAEATGERFKGQLKAYQAAPEIYKREQKLTVLEETLDNIRKYIVAADPEDSQVFIIDLQEKLTPDLYDISGIEETGKK